MSIIRLPKQRNYSSISNQLAQDNTLSFEARGVMLYLLSHGNDWTPLASDIEKAGNFKKDKRQRILHELERAGYMTYHRVQNGKGHWGWEIQVHEEPVSENERTEEVGTAFIRERKKPTLGENRPSDKPTLGQTDPRKTLGSLIKNEVRKNDSHKIGERNGSAPPFENFTPSEDLKPQLSPLEEALRTVKRWPETLSPSQYDQILRTARDLCHYDPLPTPEAIRQAPAFYRERKTPSWALSWLANDWPELSDWAIEHNGNGNGNGNGHHYKCSVCRDKTFISTPDGPVTCECQKKRTK